MKNENASINAKRLKKMREQAGFSQVKLALESDTSLDSLRSYESGRRDLGKAEGYTLLKYAQLLGCKVEDLIIDIGEQNSKEK